MDADGCPQSRYDHWVDKAKLKFRIIVLAILLILTSSGLYNNWTSSAYAEDILIDTLVSTGKLDL